MAEFLQDNLRVFVVPVDIMEVPDLDVYEQMVYIVLRSFANAREATAFPSYNTIAKLGRMSRRKAIDCVTSLVEKGLLKKEVRLDVTKNRKIRNTSNLYTLESPQVVHAVHQGGAQRAPVVVHAVHQGGAQRAPEHNHLTKSFRTKSFNKNNNNEKNSKIVDDVHNNKIETLLINHGININSLIIKKWKKLESEENIILAIKETLKRNDIKNVLGYITRMLEMGFTPSQTKPIKLLPSYIANQSSRNSSTHTINVDDKQRKEALELLFQLGEINEQEYYKKLNELEMN
jgi:hypothetical protein